MRLNGFHRGGAWLLILGLLYSPYSASSEPLAEPTPRAGSAQLALSSRFAVPDTVSPAAQALLEKFAATPIVRPPPPGNTAEWKARVERYQQGRGRAGLNRALQRAEGVTIETGTLAGVGIRTVRPPTVAEHNRGRVLMQLHGGAYIYNGGELTVTDAIPVVQRAQIEVVSVDYRMPPDHPFPAAVEDAVAVYRELLKHYQPRQIGIIGSSAGGGLAASMILAARDQGLSLPGAVVLRSPASDLSRSGDSFDTLAGLDPILHSYEATSGALLLYAGGSDLKTPLLSPVYGDFSRGFPPTMLITGTRDLFLSNTVRLHRKLRQAGVDAELHVFEGMWHGFYGIAELPEAADGLDEIVGFFNSRLGATRARAAQGIEVEREIAASDTN